MALFKGDTTAWEDAQIKMGNFAERAPPSPSNEERSKELLSRTERIVKQDFVNSILRSAVDDEGKSEESDLASLRQARLEQLMRQGNQVSVRRITKESYLDEVTEGSKTAVVVVAMNRQGGSSFQEAEWTKLSREWVSEIAPKKGFSVPVRFYVGDVDELVGCEFPKTSLPFAVIYADGKCQIQLSNASGHSVRKNLIDFCRQQRDAVVGQDSADEDDERVRQELRRRKAVDSSDDSEDESDYEKEQLRSRGYLSTHFERDVLRYRQ